MAGMLTLLTDYGMVFAFSVLQKQLTCYQVLLVPLAYTIVNFRQYRSSDLALIYNSQGKRYNITNEAIIGACFLPAGLGNIGEFWKNQVTQHRLIRRCSRRSPCRAYLRQTCHQMA